MSSSPGDAYFHFENMQVRIVTTHKVPAVETPGITIKETEAGREMTVPFWVAMELLDAGLARLTDEGVSGGGVDPDPLPGAFPAPGAAFALTRRLLFQGLPHVHEGD